MIGKILSSIIDFLANNTGSFIEQGRKDIEKHISRIENDNSIPESKKEEFLNKAYDRLDQSYDFEDTINSAFDRYYDWKDRKNSESKS